MSASDPHSFNDPQLKAAIARAWGGEMAPAALRERVEAMGLGAAKAPAVDLAIPASAGTPGRSAWRAWPSALRRPGPVYALAAVVMMVIGFTIAYQFDQPPASRGTFSAMVVSNGSDGGGGASAADVVPVSLADGLITTHARCARSAEHDAIKDLPGHDFDTVRRRLGRELNFPVLAAPVDDGKGDWDFRGGAICPVDGYPAAHLLFARRGQSVSLFSLPRSSCPRAHAGDVIEGSTPGHPLAIFVGPSGVQCVVGSSDDGSMSPADLHEICQHLRPYLE